MNLASAAVPPAHSIARLREAEVGSEVFMGGKPNLPAQGKSTFTRARYADSTMTIGKRIHDARTARGFSQSDVARFFDPPISRNAVSLWESNSAVPTTQNLLVLSRRLVEIHDRLDPKARRILLAAATDLVSA